MRISLNLIPDDRKAQLRRTLRMRAILDYGVLLAVVPMTVIAVFLALAGAVRIEQRNIVDLSNRPVATGDVQRLQESDQRIAEANRRTASVIAMEKSQERRAGAIVATVDLVPSQVQLTSLTVDVKRVVTVRGVAKNRDVVVAFKEAMEASSCFADVALPLASVVQRDDVPFALTATARETCL